MCLAGFHHASYQIDDVQLSGSAINEITDKNSFPSGMAPNAAGVCIAEFRKQANQLAEFAVNVTDYIELHLNLLACGLAEDLYRFGLTVVGLT
jgi:hypothetical protein